MVKCAARPGQRRFDEERESEMKGYLAILVVAVATTAFGQQQAPAGKPGEAPKLSIAVIDVQTLVTESASGKEIKGRLQKLADEKRTQAAKMQDEHDTLAKQIQTQAATLTDAKLAELKKQLEDKEVAMHRFDDDAKQQLDEAQRKELEALEKQIMPIIQELGREMKVQLIFNKFQSGLVYADEAADITDVVLKRFNTRVTK
ncbi:MAG: OmpH family outer membrane protein [Thermoanaerobaculales bacterium]